MSTPAPFYADEFVTLYHGDARELVPLLGGGADVLVTDPPYGIGWKRSANAARASKPHAGIANDEDTTTRDAVLALLPDLPAIVFGSFYAPHPPNTKQVLVWPKPPDAGVVGSTTGYRRDAEPVFLVGPWPVRSVEWSSVLPTCAKGIAAVVTATGHPHTKPVALMRTLLRRCPPGVVLDPFAGSGSTLVAAKQLRRRAIGIELDEAYCLTIAGRCAAESALFSEAA